MKFIITFSLLLLTFADIFANNICNTVIDESIEYGIVDINSINEKNINIQNNSAEEVIINRISINSSYSDMFEIKSPELPFKIQGGNKTAILIKLLAKQNIDISGMLVINLICQDVNFSVALLINAKITVANILKDAAITDNKFGAELAESISSYLSNHNSYSYRDARKLFWGSFDKRNGLVECIYTGKTIDPGIDPDFTALDSKGFNTEHSWPKSLGAENVPAESDINHLFVTDKTTNDKRANYPFGFVKSGITYENGGSKLGKNSKGDIAFEVRDLYKGNIARAIFYFALRYNNPNKFLNDMENDLREWIKIDPVDDFELSRNDSVLKYQKKSNLFIQFPQIIDRIPSISNKSYPEYFPNYFISDTAITLDISKLNTPGDYDKIGFWVTNFSNTNNGITQDFEIESIETKHDIAPNITITYDNDMLLSQNEVKYFEVQPLPNASVDHTIITLHYKGGMKQSLKVNTVNPFLSINEPDKSNLIKISNYPNPASGYTRISIDGLMTGAMIKSVKVYDINYTCVSDLSQNLVAENSGISIMYKPENSFSKNNVYFICVELMNRSIVHPVLFLN